MTENITREEMGKAKDAFYWGDIGDTETGYKLLHKDEETINLIGKVLFNLANNKMNGDIAERFRNYEEIAEVVGSLMIDQFKGDDKQDHYRAVINEIFKQYKDRDVETSEQENR